MLLQLTDETLKKEAWDDLLHHLPLTNKQVIWTNDCATWTLDAIFLKETISPCAERITNSDKQ